MADGTQKRASDDRSRDDGERVAVALGYQPGEDAAPKVLAGGRGQLAERIIAEAKAHDIPVRADPDLASILSAIEVGCLIPEAAFVAVAEILSYLYQINGRLQDMPAEEGGS